MLRKLSSVSEVRDLAQERQLHGLYEMRESIYHSCAGISKSGLDKIARSPSHYRYSLTETPSETAAMKFGTALHSCVLDPIDVFRERVKQQPEINRKTKAGKEEYAKFKELSEASNATIVSAEEYERIIRMKNILHSHDTVATLLEDAALEVTCFHVHEFGALVKSRADIMRSDGIIADIKTTDNASYKEFQRSIANFRYHVQAAFYLDNFSIATQTKFDTFVYIVIEKLPPHGVAIYVADPAMIEKGRAEYRDNLRLYSQCLAEGVWPGYCSDVVNISLPAWA